MFGSCNSGCFQGEDVMYLTGRGGFLGGPQKAFISSLGWTYKGVELLICLNPGWSNMKSGVSGSLKGVILRLLGRNTNEDINYGLLSSSTVFCLRY